VRKHSEKRNRDDTRYNSDIEIEKSGIQIRTEGAGEDEQLAVKQQTISDARTARSL
jgi:hypothetical protein